MGQLVSRREANDMINSLFLAFHHNLMNLTDTGINNSEDLDKFWDIAWKVNDASQSKDYNSCVSELDAVGFKKYYKLVSEFAIKFRIGDWRAFEQKEPVLIEELGDELARHEKTEDKLELIDSFTVEELQSEYFVFDSKVQVLYDILDDWFVLEDKERGINKVLESFTSSDKASFIAKIQSDRRLLDALISKVNLTQKDEMLATMGEIFISSGFIKDQKIENLNNINNDDVSATYTKGSVFIEVTKPVTGGMRDYSKTVVKTVCASPFDIIGMNYDGREIRVPALLLLNSWSNCMATPEGIFFNYKYENIDWNTLDDKQKDGYFYKFVAHYLPSSFVEAFGNPLQMIVMSCIAILTGGLFAELGTALAAAGIGMSLADAKSAVGQIIQANNEKEAARTMHEAKKAAKHMAKGIAKLTLDVINVICTVAGYLKGKKKIAKNETVDSDATVKKYLDNLNEKSIKKLRKRDDGYEILKSYEEYFGDNIDFVNELIENTSSKEIYVDPVKLLVKNAEQEPNFYEFCQKIKTNCPTNEQWVKCQIDCYNNLPKASRLRINAQPIISARYLKDGKIDWPKFMGMKPETIKGISLDNNLPTNLSRKGVTDFGNTFGDNPNLTNAEIAIPYLDNPQAVHFANLSKEGKKRYFEIIDALNDNKGKFCDYFDDEIEALDYYEKAKEQLDKFYSTVITEMSKTDNGIQGFVDKNNYVLYFKNIATNTETQKISYKYGLQGIIAPWKPDEAVLIGGGNQFSLPFTMDLLEDLDIIDVN